MTQSLKTCQADAGDTGLATPDVQDQGFGSFYADVAADLVAGLKRRFGDGPPDPEDVAQEAFRRIFENPNFAELRDRRSYLWRIALNLAATEQRKMGIRERKAPDIRDVFFPAEGDISTPESVLNVREQLEAIRQLLGKMPERRQRIFMMRRIENLTQTEIAKILGISRSGVIKHLVKADQQLNELLLEDED